MAEKRRTPLAGESAGKRFCQAFRRESACAPSDAAGGYKEVKKGYLWPDSDNDGIPDIWEQAYGMNPEDPTDANQISTNVDPNGRYSNLEVYFHNLVQHIVYYQNEGGLSMERK